MSSANETSTGFEHLQRPNPREILRLIPRAMKIISEAGGISKEGWNSSQGYKFERATDLKSVTCWAFGEVGITPQILKLYPPEESVWKGDENPQRHVVVKTIVRLLAPDGSYLDYEIMGEAADWGDKLWNKVHTSITKNLLKNALLFPIVDPVEDTENDSPSFSVQKKKKQKTPSPAAAELEKNIIRAVAAEHLDGIAEDVEKLKSKKERNWLGAKIDARRAKLMGIAIDAAGDDDALSRIEAELAAITMAPNRKWVEDRIAARREAYAPKAT